MRRREPASAASPTEILSLRQLAEYLMVSEKTIYRMTEKRELPAFRVGTHWRFRRDDIDAWLGEQVRKVEYEGHRAVVDDLSSLEGMTIGSLLEPENVRVALAAPGRDELITDLVTRASLDPQVNREKLVDSILRRESLCSTALLDGVAFPHPVAPEEFRFTRKRMVIATLREPCDFHDPHGHSPQVVALILTRSLQGHLLALSRALKLFGEAGLVERLVAARSPEEVISLVVLHESRLSTVGRPSEVVVRP
jgi:excisionase family DNA binding protein